MCLKGSCNGKFCKIACACSVSTLKNLRKAQRDSILTLANAEKLMEVWHALPASVGSAKAFHRSASCVPAVLSCDLLARSPASESAAALCLGDCALGGEERSSWKPPKSLKSVNPTSVGCTRAELPTRTASSAMLTSSSESLATTTASSSMPALCCTVSLRPSAAHHLQSSLLARLYDYLRAGRAVKGATRIC